MEIRRCSLAFSRNGVLFLETLFKICNLKKQTQKNKDYTVSVKNKKPTKKLKNE